MSLRPIGEIFIEILDKLSKGEGVGNGRDDN
jgi:hypothetical protein